MVGIREVRETPWQPIETAPKDGTRILVANDQGADFVQWYEGDWTVGLREFGHGYIRPKLHGISHWLPLSLPQGPGGSLANLADAT